MNCPCNPTKLYIDCCKKAHQNITAVNSPEQLMRSRYSAFVLVNIEYLQKSHHSSTRPSKREKKEILQWTKSVEWIRLEILNTTENTVEFKAYFKEKGELDIIHENSLFCFENKHWVYKKFFDK
jgi:SEC-C motif-containing protein